MAVSNQEMRNAEIIREKVYRKRLHFYEVAAFAGVSYATVNRWLRAGISEERFERLNRAIDDLDAFLRKD